MCWVAKQRHGVAFCRCEGSKDRARRRGRIEQRSSMIRQRVLGVDLRRVLTSSKNPAQGGEGKRAGMLLFEGLVEELALLVDGKDGRMTGEMGVKVL